MLLVITFSRCENDTKQLFDKSADERVAEAKTNLRNELYASPTGWTIKYRPEQGSGSFYVLLTFKENNFVTIRTDLGAKDGEFIEQTITYRIDSSLGLQLIFESYSFFSYLFEQDQATFQAEYELEYVNKTPDGALVFKSKTDTSDPTIITFVPSAQTDLDLLGPDVAKNLNTLSEDPPKKFSSSLALTYENKDLVFYLRMDELKRTVAIDAAAKKSDPQASQLTTFSSPYIIKGDSLVLDNALTGVFAGNTVRLKSILFKTFSEATLNVCPTPTQVHAYAGITNSNDKVSLQSSIVNLGGTGFTQTQFLYNVPQNVFQNGTSQYTAITTDLPLSQAMVLYYNASTSSGKLYGLGFFISNKDGSSTTALKKFTPVLNGNNIVFQFDTNYTLFGNQNPDVDFAQMDKYIGYLTEGDHTYVYKYSDNLYEFSNPCNGWTFAFFVSE